MASHPARLELIRKLQASFGGHVISYVTCDRPNLTWHIAQDQVRWLYEQILSLSRRGGAKERKLILFLHSRGGDSTVPWAVVNMIREHFDEFNVVIPFRAHSAATAISIGADRIFMGPKGELSPIDVKLGDTVAVEDVRGYIRLVREKALITDQHEVASLFKVVAEKLADPLVLGHVDRLLAQTRYAATGLLRSRRKGKKLDDSQVERIAKALTADIAQHEHAICRREAKKLGLPVEIPSSEQEDLMWQLYLEYEKAMFLQRHYFPLAFMPTDRPDSYEIKDLSLACLESEQHTFNCVGTQAVSVIRQMVGSLNVQLNFNLPADVAVQPNANQQQFQALLQVLHQSAVQRLQAELKKLPIMETRVSWTSFEWLDGNGKKLGEQTPPA
jgi:hypothetical protein